jgi:ATP-dependent exoDNAse (exonuclease V) beta subunit
MKVATKKPAADQKERDRALDPTRSFIVQAPAGSGKTSLLVSRFLKLLENEKAPENILAVTFTKKAAAEMRKRVLEQLPNAGEIAHRLRIETIDAFCLGLSRQTPVLAQLGAQPDIIEDASDYHLASAFATLENFSNPHVARLLAHLDNDVEQCARLLASMLGRRDQWLRRAGEPPSRKEIEAALGFERNKLLSRAKEFLPQASQELAEEVFRKGSKELRTKHPLFATLDGNLEACRALLALREAPPATYEEEQWAVLDAILELLKLAAADLQVHFAARGVADFTEVLQGAVRALGSADDPSALLLSLDRRINHILVDEFQDTSISQWDLLERLTAGWEQGDMRGDGRTLFVVGDPMQSIYRFREAQVALFLKARREGLASVSLEPIQLTTNFRSQAGVVDYVNAAFPKVMPSREDEASGAVPYAPSTAHHDPLPGEAASVHLFEDVDDEAKKVVELARAAEGKCAILVRNRPHLEAIVPALKAAGLRFRAIEIELLGEKQVVQDLYALTRALLHPADRIAWLAVLRAPWCGLLLSDLLVLSSDKNKLLWESLNDEAVLSRLSADGRKRLERAREPLAHAIRERLRGTLRERVEACWLALGGPACVADRTELEDAEIYLDELERLEEAGSADPSVLGEALKKLYALPDLEAPETLQVMTIHKAKGLEFDTVVLPGLGRTPNTGDPPLFLWKEFAGGRFIFAPIKEAGRDNNLAYDYLARLERDAEDLEAGRLLYVAVTRAKKRVHLLGCVKLEHDGSAKAPDKRSLLAKLWPVNAEVVRKTAAPAAESAPRIPLRRLPADYANPPPPAPVKWDAPPEGREEERIEFSWAGETARHVGVVVHRWLQRIAEDELKGWDIKRVESLRTHFERDLKRRGVQDPKLAADLVATAVRNSITSERGRWLLGPHAEARSEYRLRTGARSFVVDRLMVEQDKTRWVVDYKTSRHEGTKVEDFLDEQRKRYAAQLDAYAVALNAKGRGLYFPLHSAWREWLQE